MYIVEIIVLLIVIGIIYDKYIQRDHQLLVNYPLIGRLRYVLEEVREPFRQYFGDEKFFYSKDKLDWIYRASRNVPTYSSFSPTQPLDRPKYLLKHANRVYNIDEVDYDFGVTIGAHLKTPFVSKSIIIRSAMSDGAISPEGTRAFAEGSYLGEFPINTGEGGLTSNFLINHNSYDEGYVDIKESTEQQRTIKWWIRKIFNPHMSARYYRNAVLGNDSLADTYLYNKDDPEYKFFRINWDAPLENFPKEVPSDVPDIIFQMSSGMYGVRDKDGNFDEVKYQKVMKFCKMTEIKIAQGAKQTGGKLMADKVTEAIAYFRGIEAGKDVKSPNRFPYANSIPELFDFIQRLEELSNKPVGIKIVISNISNIEPFAKEIQKRVKEGRSYPSFISVDGGDGGSATAPLEMMERIGLNVKNSIYLVDKILKEYDVRGKVKLIASGKILTPDDIAIVLCLGADMVGLGRGFMMSAGCIRARYCSGTTGRQCPVGLATQDINKRKRVFVHKHSEHIMHYHANLLKSLRELIAVMGVKNIKDLNSENLMYLDKDGKVYEDMEQVFERKLKLKS
jgi:glutamate synthase domain-containing protein 2